MSHFNIEININTVKTGALLCLFLLWLSFSWFGEMMALRSGSIHTQKAVFGFFWITWLVPKREGPLLASSGAALERLLLCGKHYDMMEVDLPDLMERADVVLKPACDEKQTGIRIQKFCRDEISLNFTWNILDWFVHVDLLFLYEKHALVFLLLYFCIPWLTVSAIPPELCWKSRLSRVEELKVMC